MDIGVSPCLCRRFTACESWGDGVGISHTAAVLRWRLLPGGRFLAPDHRRIAAELELQDGTIGELHVDLAGEVVPHRTRREVTGHLGEGLAGHRQRQGGGQRGLDLRLGLRGLEGALLGGGGHGGLLGQGGGNGNGGGEGSTTRYFRSDQCSLFVGMALTGHDGPPVRYRVERRFLFAAKFQT